MSVPTEQITAERLTRWGIRMREAHATPLMLVGVGHDQNNGKIVICTLEEPEIDTDTLRMLLQRALDELG
ncbi:MAG TPA: hypothetical protein VND65_01845 [Candidatus Binatia bacterium]|nr:hypothetical protein [Candidatus Binatia bacterium]